MSWPIKKLGEFVEVIMGQAPLSEECNKEGNGTIFVKAGEFGKKYPIIREWTTRPLKLAKQNDTLVCVVGATCGKVNKASFDCAIGRSVAAIRPKSKAIDENFLFLFLKTKVIFLRNKSQGAAQGVITREMINSLEISLPPLAEQQRIAEILDKAELIKHNRELAIEKLDLLAETIFVEMFGDPLENVKNWQQKSLGDVLNLITYGLTVRPTYVDIGIPLISAREIRNGSVDIQNGPKISRSDYDNLSDKSKPNFGDILFSKTGSIGHCALVETKSPFAVTQNAARLSFEKSTVNTIYALNYLRFGSIQALAQRSARGNAVKDLQLGVMKQFPFPLPPLSLQDQFAKRIAKLDQIKADSINAFIKQKQLFLTLEHQAFSGQL